MTATVSRGGQPTTRSPPRRQDGRYAGVGADVGGGRRRGGRAGRLRGTDPRARRERRPDVRLVTWQLSTDGTSASRVADPLVGGLPINQSGRHSGCRPTVAPDGALLVGTGDTARASLAQDLNSLGGKVLRIDLATGGP